MLYAAPLRESVIPADLRCRPFEKDSSNAENPALDFRSLLVALLQIRTKEAFQGAVSAAHPRSDRVCIVLMVITTLPRKTTIPKRRIHLRYQRSPSRDVPAVERPRMNPANGPASKKAKPWQTCMGRLRHGALHVEVKDRLGPACTHLREPAPLAAARTCSCISPGAIAYEIDVDIVLVAGPMELEIV